MINIEARQALNLPVDELALQVLADLVEQKEWNAFNYSNSYQSNVAQGYSTNLDARRAIAEAIGWLEARGLIAKRLDSNDMNAIFVTRWGHEALKKELREIQSVERIQENLHPLIQSKVRPQFLLGEYENAIFGAMRAVEVRVRKLGGFSASDIGVALMKQAFKAGGPLADSAAPAGEVDGTMAIFWGAYAVLRNPSGHREVSFDDVTEASEAVMTASLLMRMLDKIEARLSVAKP